MAWKIDSEEAVYAIHQNARTFRRIFIGLVALVVITGIAAPPPFAGLMAILGWLVIAFLFRFSSTNIDARFDRTANRVTIEGSRWFAKRWTIDAPLSELAGIATSCVYMGRGRRWYYLRAQMRDGHSIPIWMPAVRGGKRNVDARAAEITDWLHRA